MTTTTKRSGQQKEAGALIAVFDQAVQKQPGIQLQVLTGWTVAVYLARKRDGRLMAKLLRDAAYPEVPVEIRQFLADVMEGKVKLGRRGGSPVEPADQELIRMYDLWFKRYDDLKRRGERNRICRDVWIAALAGRFKRSKAVIYDVLAAKRRGYVPRWYPEFSDE